MSLQQVLSSDPRQFYLNDRPVTDVWSVDEEAGEITFRERHWSTGELITEPDGSPRLVTSPGKVRIEGTLPPVSSVIPGERYVPDYAYGGDLPCPMCGSTSCPPSGCDNFCCWNEKQQGDEVRDYIRAIKYSSFRDALTDGFIMNFGRNPLLDSVIKSSEDLRQFYQIMPKMDIERRLICRCPDCQIEHMKQRNSE